MTLACSFEVEVTKPSVSSPIDSSSVSAILLLSSDKQITDHNIIMAIRYF
nr:MAG TPA: hypothetical protein [Caudoviricetes sp.]DAU82334.1 MAG TPA: hypothetical protein [Bacteriophage sp.]